MWSALTPIAQETGDAPFLAAFQPLDRFESGAERQRRLYRDAGNWKVVIEEMKDRLAQELTDAGRTERNS